MKKSDVVRRLRLFESLCHDQGLAMTVQRRDVLEAVLARDDHPTAEQVYERVKERIPGLSRTTVYRALDKLVELDVIRRLHHPGPSARFDGKIDRHHHLVCRKCGRVIDVESRGLEKLRLSPALRQGFQIEDYSVHFTGICKPCTARISR